MNWSPKVVNVWTWIIVMSCAVSAIFDKKKIGWVGPTVNASDIGPENEW